MSGLTDEEAERMLDEMGVDLPDEKKTIELATAHHPDCDRKYKMVLSDTILDGENCPRCQALRHAEESPFPLPILERIYTPHGAALISEGER